ncbi:MAG: Ku protein [Firmicutes bacterium ZCTH02-B6]|nr:MAG: Ku protein [Firmicutes bacterium ZCTH02-B6]
MRALWKGAVSFGLVHIPIKVYPATQSKDVSFNQLHRVCGSRIRYVKFCPHCQREVAPDEIVRGYEYDKDRYVVVTDEELDDLAVEGTRTIDIQQFVRLEEIDPIYFDKTYYLEPADGGQKAYHLLRAALQRTSRIALARVVLRSKGSLCCVRVRDNVLIMETMFYPDEIRSPQALEGIADAAAVSDRELSMAVQLVENLSEPFEPGQYDDEYRRALIALINEKVRGAEVTRAPVPPVTERVADLMAALEASLRATAKNGQDRAAPHGRREREPEPEPAGATRGRRQP